MDKDVWLYILGAVVGGVTYIVKFLQKKFEEKEAVITKLREENKGLLVSNTKMKVRLEKKIPGSRGRRVDVD